MREEIGGYGREGKGGGMACTHYKTREPEGATVGKEGNGWIHK